LREDREVGLVLSFGLRVAVNVRLLGAPSHRDHTDDFTDIYVMRPDGSGATRLTHDRAYTPAWSPDGSQIVFSAPGLFVMRADGSDITSLAVGGVGETALPDWL
jgi:Tol biopolymer transport system component